MSDQFLYAIEAAMNGPMAGVLYALVATVPAGRMECEG